MSHHLVIIIISCLKKPLTESENIQVWVWLGCVLNQKSQLLRIPKSPICCPPQKPKDQMKAGWCSRDLINSSSHVCCEHTVSYFCESRTPRWGLVALLHLKPSSLAALPWHTLVRAYGVRFKSLQVFLSVLWPWSLSHSCSSDMTPIPPCLSGHLAKVLLTSKPCSALLNLISDGLIAHKLTRDDFISAQRGAAKSNSSRWNWPWSHICSLLEISTPPFIRSFACKKCKRERLHLLRRELESN